MWGDETGVGITIARGQGKKLQQWWWRRLRHVLGIWALNSHVSNGLNLLLQEGCVVACATTCTKNGAP